ncbi:spore gernimation protein GerC, partial [Aneurinibacillus migulanus]
EEGGGHPKRDLITSIYQIVVPQATGSESPSQSKPYMNIYETGDSIHQMTRELSLKRERPLFGQHLKVIVMGEELVRTYSLEQLLDQYLRDNQIRPSCLVLISKGRASKTLELKETGEIPSFRLFGIVDNQYRTTRILSPMSLAKLEGKMQSGSSFLLQNVVAANGEVKFAGAAVIKGKIKKLGGFFNEIEVEGLTWIIGKGKGGVVKSFDKQTGQLLIYEVESMKSRITPHINGKNISFNVKIESEGRLSENWITSGNAFENKFLKRVEKNTEKEIKRLVKNVVEKMQEEYEADVVGFGNRLKMENPKVWEKVKKNWDQTFSKVPITYNIEVTIKDYGASDSNK